MANANKINRSEYTISADATPVPVREFRNAIDGLFRACNVHLPACVGPTEKAGGVDRIRRSAAALIAMDCKRAKLEDWDRREHAIERATSLVIKVSDELGWPRPSS